jgi:hypothetical protein
MLSRVAFSRTKRHHIPEDGILHSHRHENFKSYIKLTGWSPKLRHTLAPARYELGFYFPEDGSLHSHRRENLKSYVIFGMSYIIFGLSYIAAWEKMSEKISETSCGTGKSARCYNTKEGIKFY